MTIGRSLMIMCKFSFFFHWQMGKFQNSIILVTYAKLEGNNSYFLHVLDINSYEISLTAGENISVTWCYFSFLSRSGGAIAR